MAHPQAKVKCKSGIVMEHTFAILGHFDPNLDSQMWKKV